MQPYPWHTKQLQQLEWAIAHQKLAHAILLSGVAGIGKAHFASLLTKRLLCESPYEDGTSCGQCKKCHLFENGSHPDILQINSEDGKAIGIEKIRSLREFMSLKAQQGNKVIVINEIEKLTVNASNALLKSLEEPTPGTYLILTTAQSASLLSTIRSRCQTITFPSEFGEAAIEWLAQQTNTSDHHKRLLQLVNGAPLAALALYQSGDYKIAEDLVKDLESLTTNQSDAISLAEKWHKSENQIFEWYYQIVSGLIKSATDSAIDVSSYFDHSKETAIVSSMGINGLLAFNQHLIKALRLIRRQNNRQMILESLFLIWQKTATKNRGG